MADNINKIPDNMIKDVCNMNSNKTIKRSPEELKELLRSKTSEALADEFNKLKASVPKDKQEALINLIMRAALDI